MINTNAVAKWIIDNVLFVVFVIGALSVSIAGINKKPRDGMIVAGVLLLALAIVAVGYNIDGIIAFFQGFFGAGKAA